MSVFVCRWKKEFLRSLMAGCLAGGDVLGEVRGCWYRSSG